MTASQYVAEQNQSGHGVALLSGDDDTCIEPYVDEDYYGLADVELLGTTVSSGIYKGHYLVPHDGIFELNPNLWVKGHPDAHKYPSP